MTYRIRFPIILLSIFGLILAACSGTPTRPDFGDIPPARQTAFAANQTDPEQDTPGQPATVEVAQSANTPIVEAGTPVPTQDIISMLLTEAYAGVTPRPTTTQPAPEATSITSSNVRANYVALTPAPTVAAAPASVVVSQPVQIANAVNTVDCKIRKIGDCTPTMAKDNTIFLTWSFGVEGSQSFQWGQTAVVVTRNGEPYTWTQTNDIYMSKPDASKNEKWFLNVGQTAHLAGSVDNAQPGYYTAKLMMCTLTPDECNAGQGWQEVGGDVVSFVVEG